MIHKNAAATDYQFVMNFSATSGGPAANGQYDAESFEGVLQETWGLAYSAGSTGIQGVIQKLDTGFGWQYVVSVTTPWGSYTPAAVSGAISSAYLRFLMANAELTVSAGCNFALSFESLTVYLSVDGGAETTVLSIGAESVSGSGYDERQNATALTPSMPIALPGPLDCSATVGEASDSVSLTGGYEYMAGGVWTQDEVAFDSGDTGGTCTCLASLPAIGGTNSYNVTVGVAVDSSVTSAPISGTCPGCFPEDWTGVQFTSNSLLTGSEVTIKDKNVSVAGQNIATSWACGLDPGGDTSGSGSTSSSPGFTTCASTRNTSQYVIETARCLTSTLPECGPGFSCPGPLGSACTFVGSSILSWPNLPPCSSPTSSPLGYDVSNNCRHAIVYQSPTSGNIVLACVGNVLPQTWSAVDTGLAAVWARPRFADLGASWPIGLFHGDGVNCTWARTYDEGNTWVDSIGMGTGMTGDFDEGANGLRWLFKVDTPDGGVTFDVYGKLLDSQLNVVRDWTVTTVTGVDNAPIACRESPASDGSWRIGLLFSLSGAETIRFSEDGISFV